MASSGLFSNIMVGAAGRLALLWTTVLLTIPAPDLPAAPPAIDGVFPNGGASGTTIEASFSGKADPWPPRIWCSNPKVKFSPGEKSPQVNIEIAPDASPGPCLFRAWNEEGASAPLFFLVGENGETEIREDEKKDNGGLSNAQAVSSPLPVAVYGRLNPGGDIDCYQLGLRKGETLHAFLESYAFRTGVDPLLHLYDPQGNRIRIAHDNAVNLDPELVFPVEMDGTHILAVMAIATPPNANVSFHGGTKCTYRLNLALRKDDLPERLLPVRGGTGTEPDADLSPPFRFFGTLEREANEDVFRISAKAKERWFLEARAFSHRFPTDPVLALKNEDGTLIKEIDDVKPDHDASYSWTVRTDGTYLVSVRDRFGRGGTAFRYELAAGEAQPAFHAVPDQHGYTVEAGKDAQVKVKITREHGHKEPLELEIRGLPEGVTAEIPPIPEKGGDVTVKIKAPENAAPVSRPFQIEVLEGGGENPAREKARFSLRDKESRGPYLIDDLFDLWLTVKAAPQKEAQGEKKKEKE